MTTRRAFCQAISGIASGLALLACGAGSVPAIYEAPPYATTRVELTNCGIALPPFRERDRNLQNMRQFIRDQDLCRAIIGLNEWMASGSIGSPYLEPEDWSRVRSLDVVRMPATGSRGADSGNYDVHVYADIPGRPRLVGVSMSIPSGTMQFFTVHR